MNEPLQHVRWMAPESLHLTLAFLGEVDPETQEAFENALAEVKVRRFMISLSGVGTFGRNRPKVIWIGVGTSHPHLFALRKKILDAALASGVEADMRSFSPHVTIARVSRASAESLKPLLKNHAKTEFGIMPVSRFALYASTIESPGAEYKILNTWDLADC